MDIFELISEMEIFLSNKDWNGLENRFKTLCGEVVGEVKKDQISSVDISNYEEEIFNVFTQAVNLLNQEDNKAIYFEYDLDNSWSGGLFICTEYSTRASYDETENDDWACEYSELIDTPELEAFSELYESGFNESDNEIAINLYLIARTVASFGRIVERSYSGNNPICIGFHGQDPIFRICEIQ